MSAFFAFVGAEVKGTADLGDYRAHVHWTLDFSFERLHWRAIAWTPDHKRLFEYALDSEDREKAMACLRELNYDASLRLAR